ncbi:DUF2569 domain-containing protein [Entomohabitans teleogrylli]|uniref:DUF2569 domain-containing protein n=1 Tax=Entomohabitans teleogrylli TaxID=1384589 RepID=UPI00073D6AAC|nr:DUF2569 domain-containing protein [Entomohabitans teleogrylli]
MTATLPPRIGGWLLAPLAWLLLTLVGTSLACALLLLLVINPQTHQMLAGQSAQYVILWYFSLVSALAVWGYTLWLTVAFFKRRRCVPRHYIIWLLITLLLAIKSFAFAPVTDEVALRQLLFPLLAAALFVPYFKRSTRARSTFVQP